MLKVGLQLKQEGLNPYGFIYLITNLINGKCYVGRTIKTIESRFTQHCNYRSGCTKLRNSIQKYGKENFVVNEIDSAFNLSDLCKKESYWIKRFNSVNFGYNIMSGSGGYALKEDLNKCFMGQPKFGTKSVHKIVNEVIVKTLEVNEKEQDIIKLIKNHYIKGKTLTQIADFLNNEGYKTKNGKAFKAQTINNILDQNLKIRVDNLKIAKKIHEKYEDDCVSDVLRRLNLNIDFDYSSYQPTLQFN